MRFESPDEDPAAFRALYDAGRDIAEEHGYPVLTSACLSEACGGSAIGSPAQLAFGLEALLLQAAALAKERGAFLSADPAEIALCYDKHDCNSHLMNHGIAVPRALTPPARLDDLLDEICATAGRRAFLKINHGAGAAGTIALALGPSGRLAAYTALIRDRGALHATKRVRRISDRAEIRDLVEALIPLGLHAERWVPKAGVDGKSVDLRLVATRSGAPFPVLRMSDTPMTNLHLDAVRAPAARLFDRMPPAAVEAIFATAANVMRLFPGTAMLGLDIAVHTDLTRHSVLEANAFGDHVRNVTIDGETPQDRQIREIEQRMQHAH